MTDVGLQDKRREESRKMRAKAYDLWMTDTSRGSKSRIAERFGVTRQAMTIWLRQEGEERLAAQKKDATAA